MLKKIALATTLLSSSLFSSDILTGNTRLACEAILCLSSSTRPSECSPSLSKYFSINLKHWSDTVRERGNFLKLCPVGGDAEKDREFTNLRDNILANLENGCDLDNLNIVNSKIIDYGNSNSTDGATLYDTIQYQISPSLTKSCKALSSSAYTDIKPIYTCDPNKWYPSEDWRRGYELVPEMTLNFSAYKKLSPEEKREYQTDNNFTYTKYKKVEINKNCWSWQK